MSDSNRRHLLYKRSALPPELTRRSCKGNPVRRGFAGRHMTRVCCGTCAMMPRVIKGEMDIRVRVCSVMLAVTVCVCSPAFLLGGARPTLPSATGLPANRTPARSDSGWQASCRRSHLASKPPEPVLSSSPLTPTATRSAASAPPAVDAAVAALSGKSPGGSSFCSLFGATMPFTPTQLNALYPNHRQFVSAWTKATKSARRAGFLTDADAKELVSAAVHSNIGKPLQHRQVGATPDRGPSDPTLTEIVSAGRLALSCARRGSAGTRRTRRVSRAAGSRARGCRPRSLREGRS